MRDMLVLTVIGADRTGLVQSLAERISAAGGNWEESRMARLAGQFAGILLVTIDRDRSDELAASLRALDAQGLQVTVRPSADPEAAPVARTALRVQLTAHDRPGIVRDVSRILAEHGANVEEFESVVASAAMSGERMFTARARVLAPAGAAADLRRRLEALGAELMVDLVAE